MYLAFIAICVIGMDAPDCQRATALDWIVAPERKPSAVACFAHGAQYAAQSRLVTEGTYPKIFCVPPHRLPDHVG